MRKFFLLLILAIFLISPFSQISSVKAQEKSVKIIKAGVFPLYPLNFVNKDGQAEGLFPDVLREIFKNSEYKLEFVYGTWAQCLERLEKGEIDLISSIAKTPERMQHLKYSQHPVAEIWGQVFIKQDSHVHSIKDLEGKKVGILSRDVCGYNFIKTINAVGVKCDLIYFSKQTDIFDAIKNGEIMAGVSPQLFGLNNASKYNLIPSFIQFLPEPLFFATKRGKNENLLDFINEKIKNWGKSENSFLHQKTRFWLQGIRFEKITPSWVWLTSVIFIFLVVFFLISNWFLKQIVQKQTKELRQKENQYRELVESANTIILTVNKAGKILYMNKFGLKFFGYTKDELVGKNVINTIVPAKDRSGYDLEKQISKILENPDNFPIYENENICKDGTTLYVQWSNKAMFDEEGKFKELLTIGIDITRQKQLEKELFQNQKLEAMGTLAGGVAHDFNNILSVIFGYIELAKFNLDDPEEINKNLDEILSAAKRARDLVRHILTFSRKGKSQKQTLRISIIAKEVMQMIRSTIPSTIEIKQSVVSNSLVYADPTQIHQILMNLCTNAYHSMEKSSGILGVSLKDVSLTKEELDLLAPNLRISAGKYIQIEVSDTGTGIEPETINKIFEPYFTTKELGKGTGLGLAVVHGIISDHNGFIKVYSIPDKGTTFHVFLPIANGGEAIEDSYEITSLNKGNREKILIIDDEKQIVEILSSILIKNGYEVFGFSNPKTAFESFKRAPKSFDLVISDMTMPFLNGLELTKEIRNLRPEIPIIICSGFNELLKKEKFEELGIVAFLQKPIEVVKLLNSINEALKQKEKQDSIIPQSLV